MAPWCNPLTLQPEQSGGVGSSPGRAPPLERHDKGSQTRLGLLYFCDPSAWRWKTQLHLHLHLHFYRKQTCFYILLKNKHIYILSPLTHGRKWSDWLNWSNVFISWTTAIWIHLGQIWSPDSMKLQCTCKGLWVQWLCKTKAFRPDLRWKGGTRTTFALGCAPEFQIAHLPLRWRHIPSNDRISRNRRLR